MLIVHAPTANINCDSNDNLYEELEQVFDHFATYHKQENHEVLRHRFRKY